MAAGSDQLFMGARCIITPTKTTDAQALEQVRTMWQETGSVVLTMDAHLHDKILGAVSHLPHVAAFALINALAEIRDQQIPSLDLRVTRAVGYGIRPGLPPVRLKCGVIFSSGTATMWSRSLRPTSAR